MLCFPSLPGGKLALLLRKDFYSARAQYGASSGKVYSGSALRVLLLLPSSLFGEVSNTAQQIEILLGSMISPRTLSWSSRHPLPSTQLL